MTRGVERVVVVGAGITGLAAAHRVRTLLPDADLTVLDAADRVGGKIRTTPIAGIVVDEAADAFLARAPEGIALVRELGLDDQLVTPAERRAFVYRHGALHRFPEGMTLGVPTDLDALRDSGLVSEAGLRRAAEDLTMPRDAPGSPAPGEDETVGALVRRRVGDEIFEAFVGPLLSGVNAGDANELSVDAGAPQLAAAVRDQPSLILGLRAARETAAAGPDAPIFYGLRGGTQTLVDALTEALGPGTVRTGSPVTALAAAPGGGLTVTTPAGASDADAVVLATPTYAAAPLLDPLVPDTARDLRSLEWSSVVLVTFAFPRDAIDHPLDGSGFLVSEGEGLLMTACSFGSSKWAHWTGAPAGDGGADLVILRVSAGRHHDPRAWAMDDRSLTAALLDELATTIGRRGAPVETRVSRWERALPQYRPGHLDRARAWKDAVATAAPGLFLAGAGYFGLGLPACIRDANDVAGRIADLRLP